MYFERPVKEQLSWEIFSLDLAACVSVICTYFHLQLLLAVLVQEWLVGTQPATVLTHQHKGVKVRGYIPIRTCPQGTWHQKCVGCRRESLKGMEPDTSVANLSVYQQNANCKQCGSYVSGQHGSSFLPGIYSQHSVRPALPILPEFLPEFSLPVWQGLGLFAKDICMRSARWR